MPWDQVSRYGVVGVGEEDETGFRITGMVEKPKREDAPSNLIISGRYILQPEIFDLLGDQEPGAGGEIQITDAMKRLAETQRFTGYRYRGRTYDTGTKTGFLHGQRRLCADAPRRRAGVPRRADRAARRRGLLTAEPSACERSESGAHAVRRHPVSPAPHHASYVRALAAQRCRRSRTPTMFSSASAAGSVLSVRS